MKALIKIEQLNKITDDQIRECGYEHFINYEDFFIAITPMTYGKWRIILCDSILAVDNAWCYTTLEDALIAYTKWKPWEEPDPEGWFRNPIDGRRRPGGDKSKEYTRP